MSTNFELLIKPLTKPAFAPYGDVIETAGSNSFGINNGTTTRFHDLAKVEVLGEGGRSLISIAQCDQFSLPAEIPMMERHPLGSQAFIPLNNQEFLVVVARDKNGKPDSPVAFLAKGNQGINFHANIWHATLMAFGKTNGFLIVDRSAVGKENLEEFFFDQSYYAVQS